MQASDNLETSLSSLYAGVHPLRSAFQDPQKLDLTWAKKPKAIPRNGPVSADLCGQYRTAASSPGAFEDFRECLKQPAASLAKP